MHGFGLVLIAVVMGWCIAGVAAHGWLVLAYPGAWLLIAALFLALNKLFGGLTVKPPE